MSARDHIISILEEPNNRYINFICGRARVYGAAFRTVANAVRNYRIHVVENSTIPSSIMGYNFPNNQIWVNGTLDFSHSEIRAQVIHEMTHAIEDFHRVALSEADAEGACYIAQMMYLKANNLMPEFGHTNATFRDLQIIAYNIATRILRTGRSEVTPREYRQLVRAIGGFIIDDRHVYTMLDTPRPYNGF